MTEYQIRSYVEAEHYALLCAWWTWHEFAPVNQLLLPKRGQVIYSGETPICAAFLYSSDSAIGWIEFVVANPDAGARSVARGIDLLLESLIALSQSIGQACLFTSTNRRGLVRKYERAGFKVGDTQTTQLVRASCQQ